MGDTQEKPVYLKKSSGAIYSLSIQPKTANLIKLININTPNRIRKAASDAAFVFISK